MIRSISVDRFGGIDSLDLELGNFYHVQSGSGGDSLLALLLAAKQSFVPGYLHERQLAGRPGENRFGGGKLMVNGRLFEGGTFAECVYENSPYCSFRVEFVLENPENPVADGTDKTARDGAYEGARPGSGTGTYADKKRAGADDFRELCRLYGEKFGSVRRFVLSVEVTFAQRNGDNILSYQMVSVTCERVWEADLTSFYELVVYKNGSNYELYWDELPDIFGVRQSGRAKGCNVRMRSLQIQNIVTDGVQDGARFAEVLPSVMMISRIAAEQFETVKFLDFGDVQSGRRAEQLDTVRLSDLGDAKRSEARTDALLPCYYVGMHGEYFADVIHTCVREQLRVAWPDPVTGEIRHGLFAEAYEAWRTAAASDEGVGGAFVSGENGMYAESVCDAGDDNGHAVFDKVTETVLVQSLILRTGETLVIRCPEDLLPQGFLAAAAQMGRQIVLIQKLDRQSAELINMLTGSRLDIPEGEDKIDMCRAIDQMREQAEAIGIEKGTEIGILKGTEDAMLSSIKNLMKNMKLTAEQAMAALGIDAPEQAKYMRML